MKGSSPFIFSTFLSPFPDILCTSNIQRVFVEGLKYIIPTNRHPLDVAGIMTYVYIYMYLYIYIYSTQRASRFEVHSALPPKHYSDPAAHAAATLALASATALPSDDELWATAKKERVMNRTNWYTGSGVLFVLYGFSMVFSFFALFCMRGFIAKFDDI